jgi:hypothetical protein
LVGEQEQDSVFRTNAIIDKSIAEFAKKGIVPPTALHLKTRRNQRPPGANTSALPGLPNGLAEVYPAQLLPPRSLMPKNNRQ